MTIWGSIANAGASRIRWAAWIAWLAILLAGSLAACAGPRAEPSPPLLRVGTSGDYAPFSSAALAQWETGESPDTPPTGFDPAIATAYAADRGLAIEWVRFRWPELLADLAANRFDLAMSGVTVRPDRSLAGRFSIPVCQTGAVLLIDRQSSAFRSSEPAIGAASSDSGLQNPNRPGVRIAVNAGGHLERVTRRNFPRATVIAISDNSAVLEKVLDGTADAAATDTQEAPFWAARAPSLEIWGPFTRDQKAYLVRPDRRELAFDLDDWLQAREADGLLAELRATHLSGEQPALAADLPALVSGIAERLALMPMVAEAKRRSGGAIEVPEREERVIEAAIAKTREIARERGSAAPDPAAVRKLFRAQIEAAKAIQRAVLAGPATLDQPPDLASQLRPALIRIGDRLAGLIVGLASPNGARVQSDEVRAMTNAALAPHGLDEVIVDAIASGIAAISSRRSAHGGADTP